MHAEPRQINEIREPFGEDKEEEATTSPATSSTAN
jgi:hypothetical protein